MSKPARPRAFPLAVLLALICVSVLHAQTPSPTPQIPPISLDEALRLANTQASAFQTASLNERIAAEDVRQAQAAFLPKVSVPLSYIYTSPACCLPRSEEHTS